MHPAAVSRILRFFQGKKGVACDQAVLFTWGGPSGGTPRVMADQVGHSRYLTTGPGQTRFSILTRFREMADAPEVEDGEQPFGRVHFPFQS
jgi:hypothetical protein